MRDSDLVATGVAVDPLERLRGRRVLVTGASGFIGTPLTKALADLGSEVYATSRSDRGDAKAPLHWLQADLTDSASARAVAATARPELVYHLAAHVTGGRGLELVQPTLAANTVATVNVLVAAAEAGCERVVFAGSMEEPAQDGAPASPYAAAKWAASTYLRLFRELYDLLVADLRLHMVYGPGQQDERRVVPHTIRSLQRGEPPQLSSGRRAVDWVYVDDVIDALMRAGTADGLDGKPIDVGSGRLAAVREVVLQLVALVDPAVVPSFGALPDRRLETSHAADLTRARALLDWRPLTSLDEGLARTVRWFADRAAC
jgi:UDP-glucose 4-epimerase